MEAMVSAQVFSETHNMLSRHELLDRGFDEDEELLLPYVESDSDDEPIKDTLASTPSALQTDDQIQAILYGDPKHCHADRNLVDNVDFFRTLREQDNGEFIIPPNRRLRRVAYAGLDAEAFEELVELPCVLEGVAEVEDWPVASCWTSQETFCAANAGANVPVTELFPLHGLGKPQKLSVPLEAYAKYAQTNKVDFPYYPWERDFAGERAAWLDMFWQPRLFCDDAFSLAPQAREWFPFSTHRFVILGGQRCGAAVHQDPKASGAWNHCLFGTKRWCFFPPSVTSEVLWGDADTAGNYRELPSAYWWLEHYPRLRGREDLGMLEVLQEPGDTLYVPPGWWHSVINLPDVASGEHLTLCVTQNAVTPAMLRKCPYCWSALSRYPFAEELASLIREAWPDVAKQLNLVDLPSSVGEEKQVPNQTIAEGVVVDDEALAIRRAALLKPTTSRDVLRTWQEVPRVAASSLSLQACRLEFIKPGRPVVITGLGDHLVASNGCPWEFLQRFAAKRVCVHAQTSEARKSNCLGEPELITFGDLLGSVSPSGGVDECSPSGRYLYDLSIPHKLPELLEWWRLPRYFAHDYLQQTRIPHRYKGSWPTLFIGASGTSSTTHVDRWHGHFWMVQVAGVKRWTLWAPENIELLRPRWECTRLDPSFPSLAELAEDAEVQSRKVVIELHPGEVLFVPGGTPHAVENLTATIAYAGNFVDDSNIGEVLADLEVLATYDAAEAQTLAALNEIDFDTELGMCAQLLRPDALGVHYEHFASAAAARWSPGVDSSDV